MNDQEPLHSEEKCSFCGTPRNKAKRFFTRESKLYICWDCVENFVVEVDEHKKKLIENYEKNKREIIRGANEVTMYQIPTPAQIKEELDKRVIDQEHAKKVLAVAAYNHYKMNTDRLGLREEWMRKLDVPEEILQDGVRIERSNILLVGPTGVGKTLLAETLARILEVPFVIADATSMTAAGYVGDSAESVVTALVNNQSKTLTLKERVERAERGVVFIDEIDKINGRTGNDSGVSGRDVQQGLLKIIEGSHVDIPINTRSKITGSTLASVDTSGILFIASGAFPGIEDIIDQRVNDGGIGFNAKVYSIESAQKKSEIFYKMEDEDLIKYGLMPEFVGRFPILTPLHNLNEKALIKIMTNPKDALVKQYQKRFLENNCELLFADSALVLIARKALEQRTGARGLQSIFEAIFLDYQYDLPEMEGEKLLVITDVLVREALEAKTHNYVGENVVVLRK